MSDAYLVIVKSSPDGLVSKRVFRVELPPNLTLSNNHTEYLSQRAGRSDSSGNGFLDWLCENGFKFRAHKTGVWGMDHCTAEQRAENREVEALAALADSLVLNQD